MLKTIQYRFPFLFNEIDPERYALNLRGNLLVFAGYCIATIETFIAIKCGLTPISYTTTAAISASVLISTLLITAAVHNKEKFLNWHEWVMFLLHLIIYSITFSIWVYSLESMRILGLLNSFLAVTILISYTSRIQSLMMSLATLICYFSVVYYSITVKNQSGSLERELFLTLIMIPAFILIAVAADYLEKKSNELNETRIRLEKLNRELTRSNNRLHHEQYLSKIEMDLAQDIQRALFPLTPPVTDDWDIAFMTKPKSGVSGDFYDFYSYGGTLKGLSLFDVSGHGVASALITILAKPVIFRNFNLLIDERPGRVLKASHEDLLEQLEDVNIFITGVLLKMKNNTVEYVNAGHPDILHREYSTGRVRVISDENGSFKGGPLGIGSIKLKYNTLKFSLSSNDFIVIYSDGFTDIRNNRGEPFGTENLKKVMGETNARDASEILKDIIHVFNNFKGKEEAGDDYTVIVARKK